MRRIAALLAGIAAGGALAALLRRHRAPGIALGPSASDPRAEELRRKLAEAREQAADEDDFEAAGMAGETQIEEDRPERPTVVPATGDLDDARRRVHERARAAADEMRADPEAR